MMISQSYSHTVYVADYTHYNEVPHEEQAPCKGVLISEDVPALIPSFMLENKNGCVIEGVNFEQNAALLKRKDGTLRKQCEALFYAHREESPAWVMFLEMKYCEARQLYSNTLDAIAQLKKTCLYIMEEEELLDNLKFKRFFVVSAPNVEPLDPADANMFDQDDMLTLKEEYHATLYFSNHVVVHTPVHLKQK